MADKTTDNTEISKIRKSRKPTKCYSLTDFIVTKKKNVKKRKKTFVKKISSQPVKKGKFKRKKPSTLKKKILKERIKKKLQNEEHLEKIEEVVEELEELKIEEKEVTNCDQQVNQPIVQHSRNFRDYCDHFSTPEIKHYSEIVITDLFRYQTNKYQENPIKAKANRRYVVGFNEVKKFLHVERLKLLFIAPDLEKNPQIDKLVAEIKEMADKSKTPYVFGLKRRKLGFLLIKKVPISIIGIFDYQGTTENVNILLDLVKQEKLSYKNKTGQ
ncbi:selenocysteine insertion sequence-binding protein 2-like [Chironomus tepperi]|uniref:selenocysteine insertion sequence-binding protein 2-like n=1 Tax=Chironomus tepperi TaxID=113505 RepID=UPI00391F6C0D